MNKNRCLDVMARPPEKGKVKTRLANKLGDDQALAVYIALLNHTSRECIESGIPVRWFWSEPTIYPISSTFAVHKQQGKHLGQRMENAFETAFDDGMDEVVMIGTDCPEITAGRLLEAFDDLARVDVVIGPAKDGGYYLIGMKAFHPDLFKEMPWSSGYLLQATLERCRSLQLSFILLPALLDIDELEDLQSSSMAFMVNAEVFKSEART